MRIAWVDEDQEMVATMSGYLREFGLEVVIPPDLSFSPQPDLCVAALEVNGLALTEEVRASLPQLPILLYTATEPELKTITTLKKQRVHLIDKYAPVGLWIEKIEMILEPHA